MERFYRYQDTLVENFTMLTSDPVTTHETTLNEGQSYIVTSTIAENNVNIRIASTNALLGSADDIQVMPGNRPFEFTAMQGQKHIRFVTTGSACRVSLIPVTP